MKVNLQSGNFKTMTDEELVQFIVANGNTSLFGILYDRYAQKVFAKCVSFADSRDVAEDLVQDIFVKLYLNLKKFRGESKFSTWLYAFAYNHCVNYYKSVIKQKHKQSVLDEELLGDTIVDDVSDQELLSLNVEKLQVSLGQLDAQDRIIILMKYQDDKSIKEIATMLELGESAVKMRLHRGKKKLIEIYNSL